MTLLRLIQDDPDADWTRPGVYEVSSGLYRVPLLLPSDALRAVNVYAVRDGNGLVLVDSGWALAEARELLEEAAKLLGCSLADVRRFLVTHVHRDHYTMAVAVRREFGTRIALGRGEADTLRMEREDSADRGLFKQLTRGGEIQLLRELQSVPYAHHPWHWADPDDWIDAPQDIKLETATWHAYPTPGHTRGHVVFVDTGRDVMFAGDHVLPRITPSIGFEGNAAEFPLRDYLDSLKLVRALPDRRLLPAHGPVSPSVHTRVDELIDHHDTRLRRIQQAVYAHPGTAADIARRLQWTRHERRFDELDVFSRCLAVTETLAHLDVLAATGRLSQTDSDGTSYYDRALLKNGLHVTDRIVARPRNPRHSTPAPAPPVSRRDRQPATGPPDSYPDQTSPAKRRRAYESVVNHSLDQPPISTGRAGEVLCRSLSSSPGRAPRSASSSVRSRR